jgi:ubiquinone/menaquinone biosynthesis C-methylase UbiE
MRFPHEYTDRHGALLEAHRVLKTGGVLSNTGGVP